MHALGSSTTHPNRPLRRAENSWTHRHLCEFMGLDFEMAINEHYFEVLDVIEGLFETIFTGLKELCGGSRGSWARVVCRSWAEPSPQCAFQCPRGIQSLNVLMNHSRFS